MRFERFVDDEFLSGFYTTGNRLRKATHLASRSLERLRLAFGAAGVDAVFIQREAALVGPADTEFILHSFKGLPLIVDFDDAIWDLNLSRSPHAHSRTQPNAGTRCAAPHVSSPGHSTSPSVHVRSTPTSRSCPRWCLSRCERRGPVDSKASSVALGFRTSGG